MLPRNLSPYCPQFIIIWVEFLQSILVKCLLSIKMAKKLLFQDYMPLEKLLVSVSMVLIVLVRILFLTLLFSEELVLIISNRLLRRVSSPGEDVDIGKPHKPVSADLGAASIANLDKIRQASGPEPTAKIRLDMQKVMQT